MAKVMSFRATPFGLECWFSCLSAVTLMSYLTILEKEKFSFQSQRKAMPKNVETTAQLHSFHMLAMFKILQARLQQYVNRELPDVQAGFRKGSRTRDQIANIHWIMRKTRKFQKKIFCFIDYAKAFDCVNHNTLCKIIKKMGVTDHLNLPPEKPVYGSRSNRTGH